MSKSVILLTTANGKQCRHLIPLLIANSSHTVRGFVHSEKSAEQLKSDFNHPQNLETHVGDLTNEDIARAMAGVSAVFHVGPPLSVHESHIGILVIKAAEKAGVEHFI